jgi:hypothetical protein
MLFRNSMKACRFKASQQLAEYIVSQTPRGEEKTMKHIFLYAYAISAMLLMGPATASADPSLNERLKGRYAVTGEEGCLISLDGFNAGQQAVSGRVYTRSGSILGVRTYNGNGTGKVEATSVSISMPSSTFAFPADASSSKFSFSFTYDVQPNGTFTTDMVPGSFSGTILTGPRAGQTYTIDKISFNGLVAQDGNILELATVVPQLEIQKYSDGFVEPLFCHRSRVHARITP